MPVRKTTRHNMELDLHQGHANSCSAQNCQSRQDNPVCIVDGICSKSKYAYENMSNFSLYRISLLTDDTNITDYIDNICSAEKDLATTWWWTKCHALGVRLTSTQIVRIHTSWTEWSHQYALCLNGVFDTIEAEGGNITITVEEVGEFGCCEAWTPDLRYLKRQGQEVIIEQECWKSRRFLVKWGIWPNWPNAAKFAYTKTWLWCGNRAVMDQINV